MGSQEAILPPQGPVSPQHGIAPLLQRQLTMAATSEAPRRTSLREQPNYLKEVSTALTRREELIKLKERLSSNRDLLAMDHSSKPWLIKRSMSTTFTESLKSSEVGSQSSGRSRSMSHDTSASSDHSFQEMEELLLLLLQRPFHGGVLGAGGGSGGG